MAADTDPMKIDDIVKNVGPRSRILVQGTITKAISFDTMVLDDGTGKMVLDLTQAKNELKVSDTVVVYGKYRGTSTYRAYNAEMLALELASPTDTETVKKLGEKFAKNHPITKEDRAKKKEESAPKVEKSVEGRLEELEKLKSKNLVTPEEYQEQRKRLLNDL